MHFLHEERDDIGAGSTSDDKHVMNPGQGGGGAERGNTERARPDGKTATVKNVAVASLQ